MNIAHRLEKHLVDWVQGADFESERERYEMETRLSLFHSNAVLYCISKIKNHSTPTCIIRMFILMYSAPAEQACGRLLVVHKNTAYHIYRILLIAILHINY